MKGEISRWVHEAQHRNNKFERAENRQESKPHIEAHFHDKMTTLEGVREKQHRTGNQEPWMPCLSNSKGAAFQAGILQWPEDARMKTLSNPQVRTPFIRKLLEKIPLKQEIRQEEQNHRKEMGDPKQERRKGRPQMMGKEIRKAAGPWAWQQSVSGRTRDQRGCCQEKKTYLSDRFPYLKRYTLVEGSLGTNYCAQNTNINIVIAIQMLNT